MKARLNKILDLFSETLILGVVFLVPIFFSPPFFITANTFELNKIVLFKILTLCLLAVTALKAATDRNFRVSGKKRLFSFSWNWLVIGGFFLALALATVFSIDPQKSFFGSYDRQQGLSAQIYYLLFFVALVLNVFSFKQIKRILSAIVLSSAVVCGYGLSQQLGYDFMSWSESIEETNRVTSTFGQPNFLGIFLLLAMPATVLAAVYARKRVIGFLCAGVLGLELLNLLYIYSLSIWLSLFSSMAATGFFYVFVNRKNIFSVLRGRFKKAILPAAVLILLAAGVFYGLHDSWFLSTKIKQVLSLEGSAGTRLIYWRAAWDASKQKPFLGFGPETQADVLTGYYDKDWGIYAYVNVRPDRAHNIILDTLLTGGWLGLAGFSVLLFSLYRFLYRGIRSGRNGSFFYLLFLAITSYLVSLFLNFSFVTAGIYFWLYFSLIFLSATNLPEAEEVREESEERPRNKTVAIFKAAVSAGVVLLCIFMVNRQIKVVVADHYYFGLDMAARNNDYFTALTLYDYIDELETSTYFGEKSAALVSGLIMGSKEAGLRRGGDDAIRKILPEIKSESYTAGLLKAKLSAGLAAPYQAEFYERSEAEYRRAINHSPRTPGNYTELAGLYRIWGKNEEAIVNYNIALSLLPDISDPRLDYLHQEAIGREIWRDHGGMGDILMAEADYAGALDHYLSAGYFYRKEPMVYYKILQAYYRLGDLDSALTYGRRGYKEYPGNYLWPHTLGQLYYETGDFLNAQRFTEEARRMAPNDWAVNELIGKINGKLNANRTISDN
ncbi:MAG: O-antigen ligase family protein [Candidatus Falkowbacteria bacterium]